MQIVIDIPVEVYEFLSQKQYFPDGFDVTHRVMHGIPLPKGHGDLKDSNKVKAEVYRACMDEHFMPMKFLDCDTINEAIDNAPTIIERG